jgi:hypothetical protein
MDAVLAAGAASNQSMRIATLIVEESKINQALQTRDINPLQVLSINQYGGRVKVFYWHFDQAQEGG